MQAQLDIAVTPPQESCAPTGPNANRCSTLERMPKWLICIPLAFQCLWLALRYRSFTLPSAANAAITSSGLVGEGKLEYFHGMGAVAGPIPELDEWLRRRVRMCLETVALVPHEDQPPASTGGELAHRDHYRCQQQKLPAPVAVKGDASRDVERMAEGTGSGEYPFIWRPCS